MSYGDKEGGEQVGCQHPTSAHQVGCRLNTVIGLFKSKKEAADTLEISTDQLARYIKGQVSPPLSVLIRLSAAKGISLDWLASGQGEMFGSVPLVTTALTAIDQELNARVVEAVSTVYKECGGRISPRDLGRVSAEIYNDIAQAGLSSWDEKMGALGLAAAQLRRRLLAPPEPASTQGKHSA